MKKAMEVNGTYNYDQPELIESWKFVAYSWATRAKIMSDPIMNKIFKWQFDGQLFPISEIIDTIELATMPDNIWKI